MKLEGPVEVVFDTSVIIGAILESLGEEKGSSRIALNSLIKHCNHTLRISEDIRKECREHFNIAGFHSNLMLKVLLGQLEPENKIKKISYRPEDINLEVSVPEHDRHVAEAAVAVKGKRKGITVCLVTKNLRHFRPEEWRKKHKISVLSPEEYVAP